MSNQPITFNLKTYQKLLSSLLDNNLTFISFDKNMIVKEDNSILLRHDIDADLFAACEMAKIENRLGISSTYFLMLRSPVYNLFSRHNQDFVREILDLGHDIGLHYDQGYRPKTNRSDAELIEIESRVLEDVFEVSINSVSFHQPGAAVLQGQVSTGEMINTYDTTLLNKFEYFSDSNRQFGLLDYFSSSTPNCYDQSFQILIHPIWWVYDDRSTFDVWDKTILKNLDLMQEQMLATERAYGSARKFKIE